jgi:hypothetical protein
LAHYGNFYSRRGISLLVEINSLFSITGNPSLSTWERSGKSALVPPETSRFEEFLCIFPVEQGSAPRDEFAPDFVHRHQGNKSRDFPLGFEDGSGKAREFAGCWRLRSFDTEVETGLIRGGSGPVRG